ncbi:YceI family protein [Hyphobacterium sp. CCMP332]|nr:YceI family protein [Hyphobacterium sp. CCMP332]
MPVLRFLIFILFCLNLFQPIESTAQSIDKSKIRLTKGRVDFHSNAELEVIRAHSTELAGILDRKTNQFAISIPMISFLGFNSPLQREHFNENYMESHSFPKATYSGKIVGNYDLMKEGSTEIMTKGELTIHGISVEQNIPVNLVIKHGIVGVRSNFKVALADYNIKIPKAVEGKIAEIVDVEVYALFQEN